jgi:hypothetical protein
MHMTSELSVTGKLKYLSKSSLDPAFYVGEPGQDSKWTGTYEEVDVQIANGRLSTNTASLDEEGFELIEHGTVDVDFSSVEAVEQEYYPQVEKLLEDRLGASQAVIFDHTIRTSKETDGARKPVRHVHNDYTAASTIQRVVDVVGGDGAIEKLRKRYAQINLWRPIGNPVYSSPLAIADARSILPEHFVKADIIYTDRRGEVYEVLYSRDHRWFYFPNMTPNEAIVFRGFDSSQNVSHRFTPHTSFEDPTTPAASIPRRSIELRAMVFFD